jgi:hypothetical protein
MTFLIVGYHVRLTSSLGIFGSSNSMAMFKWLEKWVTFRAPAGVLHLDPLSYFLCPGSAEYAVHIRGPIGI